MRRATAKAVEKVRGTRAVITDTRKTLPGLRALQKYAVTVGGGKNHRFNLSDGAMLKDNHIDAAGGIPQAVAAIREKLGHMVKLEVETRNLDEVRQALDAGADIIMLDNMDCPSMAEAVRIVDGRALLEASGGIREETLRPVAETGVDIISIGALTHSVTALDISMKIQKIWKNPDGRHGPSGVFMRLGRRAWMIRKAMTFSINTAGDKSAVSLSDG